MNKKPRKVPKKITGSYLENAALYYLQRYASSTENFRRVMMRKIERSCRHHGDTAADFAPVVEDLIARYVATGLLNDETFARARAATLRRQGRSRQAIQAKMAAKGLPPAAIAAALATVDEDAPDAELHAAQKLAQKKKLGPWRTRPVTDPKDLQKEMAAMARAGFSYDIARRVLETPDTE